MKNSISTIIAIVVAATISSVVTSAVIGAPKVEPVAEPQIVNRNWIPKPCMEVIQMDQNAKQALVENDWTPPTGDVHSVIDGSNDYFKMRLDQCMKEYEKENDYLKGNES